MRVELPIWVDGQGQPAIVQGPGWGPASDYLRKTLVPLLDGLRVLTYDVRNTGLAPRHPAPESQAVEVLVEDLEAVRRARDGSCFVLLGHSHGCFIAMAYTIRYPQFVRALVLVGPSLEDPDTHPDSADWLRWVRSNPARSEAFEWLRHAPRDPSQLQTDRDLARWLYRRTVLDFWDLEAMQRFQQQLVGAPMPSVAALHGMPRKRAAWVARQLDQVRTPTLILVGRHDYTTPVDQAQRVQQRIRGSRLVVVERAGHNPWAEQPGPFRDAIRTFLNTGC